MKRLFSILLLAGCVGPEANVTLFTPEKKFPPVPPEKVAIYRTARPFKNAAELGLLTLKTQNYDLIDIYREVRKAAGARGANAVIDLKIKGETHDETHTVEKCDDEMICDPVTGHCESRKVCMNEDVTEPVSSYLTEGSMIRSLQ